MCIRDSYKMANVQLPVLFQIADATGATLFGEEVAVDIIENHLKFTLKRDVAFQSKGFEANGTTSTLAAAFADTFYVGDDTAEGDALFYVNMIANVGKDETTPLAKKKSDHKWRCWRRCYGITSCRYVL